MDYGEPIMINKHPRARHFKAIGSPVMNIEDLFQIRA